ncbi:hypothetical protein L7F22_033815 [Adiantum nelumboides]|nr:hypothetical protein [Adiantum nelumboides]
MACPHFAAATLLPIDTVTELSPQPPTSSFPISSVTKRRGDKTISLQALSIEDALSVLETSSHVPALYDLIDILQKCRKQKDLAVAKRLHHFIRDKNIGSFEELGNYLVPTFVECGSMKEAEAVFNSIAYCNEHAWTSLIQGYTDCGDWQRAFETFERMELGPVPPNRYTFMAILRTCVRSKSLAKGATDNQLERIWLETSGSIEQFVGEEEMDQHQSKLLLAEIESILAEGKGTSDVDQRPSVDSWRQEEGNCLHTERLAIMHGLKKTPEGSSIRIVKNTQFCGECHQFLCLVSDTRARTMMDDFVSV